MKCLRCRKETTDNSSFCDECLKTAGVPLEPSPYLSTQINLSAKRKHSVTQAPASAPKTEKPTTSKNGWRFVAIMLFLLCLILAAECAWLSREYWLPYVQ